jgi:hypothetical protein
MDQIYIRETLFQSLGRELGCTYCRFRGLHQPLKRSAENYAMMTFFQIRSNSLFTSHSMIRR